MFDGIVYNLQDKVGTCERLLVKTITMVMCSINSSPSNISSEGIDTLIMVLPSRE